MTVKIQQQLDNSYSQNNIDSNNEDDQQIKVVAIIIGHYITHVGFHFLAINYLLVYILFKDAQENYSYMINDVKSWKDSNLIITFSLFYFAVYVQIIYVAKKYTHHTIPILSCSVFYGLCYVILVLNQISDTNCEKRQLLSCKDTNTYVSNRIIFLAKEYISYTLILFTLSICTYTIAVVFKNHGIKYYYYINPVKEFTTLFVLYYIYGFIVFIIPIIIICLCCTGGGGGSGNSQIDMGNFVNGTEINATPEGCIQEV